MPDFANPKSLRYILDEAVLEQYEPLIAAVAERTARIVLAELREDGGVKPRWVDIATAASHLDLTVTALRQRRSHGQIPDSCVVKFGNSLRFDLAALDHWMESLK